MKETGGKGISSITSPGELPPLCWRKMASYSKSPVVMVMVVMIARPGVAKDDLCIYDRINFCIIIQWSK